MKKATLSFTGARLKIERARRHRAELEHILAEYGSRLVTEYRPLEDDPQTYRLCFSEQPPEEIPMVIGDAAHNLRSALDLAVCEIAMAQTGSADRMKFPFAKNEKNYDKDVAPLLGALSSGVQDLLRGLQPWAGGNDLLYGLHELDIIDKHRSVMTLTACSWGRRLSELIAPPPGKTILFVGDDRPSLNVEGSLMPAESVNRHYSEPYRSNRPATALFAKGMPFAGCHVNEQLVRLENMTVEMVEALRLKA